MANPRGCPQNLKRTPKGGPSPNPKGRPPDALNKAMKKLTKQELEDIASMIIKGNLEDLRALRKDPQAIVIKAMVAGVALRTIENGDYGALNALLDRLLGKVKDEVKHTGNIGPRVIVRLPANGTEKK